jgi:hypothetical protein
MQDLFDDLGYDTLRLAPLNISAIQVAWNPEHQSTMEHVYRVYHWIRDQVEQKQIAVLHVSEGENPAGVFTKLLGKLKFTKFRSMLGLCL